MQKKGKFVILHRKRLFYSQNHIAMILTYIAVLLRVLSNPFSNVFQKKLTGNGHDPLIVNFISYLLLSIACLGFAWRVDWTSFPYQFWMYAALGGVFGAVGNGFLVMALKRGYLSVLGHINSYKSVVGIIVGILLLGELPSLLGVVGVATIIFGSYFVFDTTEEGFSWSLLKNREIQYRIWAMVLTAIEAVIIKKVILYSDTTVSFVVWCWGGALFSLLQLKVMKVGIGSGMSKIKPRDWLTFLVLIACIGTMQYTTNYTFKHMNVGYGLALFQLSIIVSIALGYKIFHEQGIVKKLVGSVIMIGGSVLIIFG